MIAAGKRAPALLVALVVAGGGAVPAIAFDGSARGKRPTVDVGDDFYSPTILKVKSGTKVKFKWLPENTDSHNVILKKGPKGVSKKPFESPTGSIGVKYAPTFKKPGTYDLLCTIHPDVMKMKVTVKRK